MGHSRRPGHRIAVFDEQDGQTRQCALFPADRTPPATNTPAVQVQLSQLQLSRPRAWGACWLGDQLWRELQLDTFFAARLGVSREGTDWEKVLRLLTLYRLLSPGSEWRLHRHWFATTACADLLGADERLAQDDTLYRGLDGLLVHKDELFAHQDRLVTELVCSYDRHQDFERAEHVAELLAQRRQARAQQLLPRFLALSPKAAEYYRALEEKRGNRHPRQPRGTSALRPPRLPARRRRVRGVPWRFSPPIRHAQATPR